MKTIFILCSILLFLNTNVLATAQIGDKIILEAGTFSIYSNPLEAFLKKKKVRKFANTELNGNCTALWRGYVATWKIVQDSLLLHKVETNYCGDSPIELNLKEEFDSSPIFADWYSGKVRVQIGALVSYIHGGYGSVYEKERIIEIKNGKVVSDKTVNHVLIDQSRIFPSLEFLQDTIYQCIIKNLYIAKLDSIKEEDACNVIVVFNSEGEVERISTTLCDSSPFLESFLVNLTKEAMQDFPKIMKVQHEFYSPPIIRIWFTGHCLKFPEDEEYGCRDYRKYLKNKNQQKFAPSVNIPLILISILVIILSIIFYKIKQKM